MKKAAKQLVSEISNATPSSILPSVIEKWRGDIEKIKSKLKKPQEQDIINALTRVYPTVYITEESLLARLIKSLSADGSDIRCSFQDSLLELGKLLLYSSEDITSIKSLDCHFQHYHILRHELSLALKNPLSERISGTITDVVKNFKEKNEEQLPSIIQHDCRIATLFGSIYFSEYKRRLLHPKREEFKVNAIEWFGMGIIHNEPCACFYFAQQLKQESGSKVKLLETARQHEYPKGGTRALPPIFQIYGYS